MVQNGEKQRLCTADDMLNRLAVGGVEPGGVMRTDFLAVAADGPTAGRRPFVDKRHRRSRAALPVACDRPDLPMPRPSSQGGN